jgi:hypothetical protein
MCSTRIVVIYLASIKHKSAWLLLLIVTMIDVDVEWNRHSNFVLEAVLTAAALPVPERF